MSSVWIMPMGFSTDEPLSEDQALALAVELRDSISEALRRNGAQYGQGDVQVQVDDRFAVQASEAEGHLRVCGLG